MSKGAKSASAEKRKKAKRARKAAQKAKYEAFKAAGQNTKSKRFRAKAAVKGVKTESHPNGMCGNVGCRKCSPVGAAPRLGHRAWLYQQALIRENMKAT